MASVSNKKRVKPPKGRPASTSSISQPVVRDSSAVTALSSFSPDGARFAFLSLAVDKHRLRVYDTFSGRAAAEHVVEAARVTVLAWGLFNSSMAPPASADDEMDRPNKKKRRKQKSLDSDTENARPPAIEVVVLGLSDGSLSLFSPSHGRALRSLSHPSSTASVLCAVVGLNDDHDTTIWTSSADSVIRHWNATRNEILRSWKVGDPMPYTSMAIKPSSPVHGSGRTDILVANHAIRLLSTASDATQGTHVDNQKPYVLASFTGHASSIARLQWDVSQDPPTRFFSMAQADRFVYLWQLPTLRSSASAEGKIIASIPLDSDARTFSLRHSTAPPSSAAAKQSVLTLSMSGKICVFPIPAELQPPAGSKGVHHKVPTLLPRSTISISIKKSVSDVQIVDAMFCAEEGRVRLAKVVGGVKPTFEVADYLDATGNFVADVTLVHDDAALHVHSQAALGAPSKRYSEPSSIAIRTGVAYGQDQEMEELPGEVDGDLDVDLAELSLGQRLTALSGVEDMAHRPPSSNSENEGHPKAPMEKRGKHENRGDTAIPTVPANSLTRTLIQALHSSDTRLLETCLTHSDHALIHSTVRRLPPQLAVPLLTACMERLGRGARGATMKGGGGGASSQRGMTLVAWIKAVLLIHNGHLMTMPDLVARLSGLHATLTTRLALQESLLSLSGRLDMLLSQIEIRASTSFAPPALGKAKQTTDGTKEVRQYLEGESDADDDEPMDAEPDVENADDGGSVEDVQLGNESEEDAESSSVDESEEDESADDDDDSGPQLNGFIDDEAEEYEDDESDDESE